MQKKQVLFKTKGMNRDLSVSTFSSEFSFENINLRLSTNEGNTTMSWVNERGTQKILFYAPITETQSTPSSVGIEGTPIGTAVLNRQLILFTTSNEDGFAPVENTNYDHIYLIRHYDEGTENEYFLVPLYEGNLNFCTRNPIETLVDYETSLAQKVYWNDDRNPLRMINIVKSCRQYSGTDIDSQFDFVPELQLKENVKVLKIFGGGGMFAPGVIQYAFTYYNKYGQESNIFYTTPLNYINFENRGASPEEKVDNSFQITIKNIDRHFDFLRIYSIQRTSYNATPVAKRVYDLAINPLNEGEEDVITYTDTGFDGDTIDPTELLYKGGESIIASAFAQKDSTLFLGNLKLQRPDIETLEQQLADTSVEVGTVFRKVWHNKSPYASESWYNTLNAYGDSNKTYNVPAVGFKRGNEYMLGVQFQYKTGKWSSPVCLGKYTQDKCPSDNDSYFEIPAFVGLIRKSAAIKIWNLGYRKARPVFVYPEVQDRRIVCQGVACPTVYTEKRANQDKDLQAQSSWLFRTHTPRINNGDTYGLNGIPSFRSLPYAMFTGWNSQSANFDTTYIRSAEIQGSYATEDRFKVNYDIFTLHSPDVVFDDYLETSDLSSLQYRKVGYAKVDKSFSDINIQTESATIGNSGKGFVHETTYGDYMQGIISGLYYDDFIVNDENSKIQKASDTKSSVKWMVYMWNKNGALNNDIDRPADKGNTSALLKKKVISNLRYSSETSYYEPQQSKSFASTPQIFSSDEVSVLKVGTNAYMGNIDTMLVPNLAYPHFFAGNPFVQNNLVGINAAVTGAIWNADQDTYDAGGFWRTETGSTWEHPSNVTIGSTHYPSMKIGDVYLDLAIKKESVRMKYKSSPHIVCEPDTSNLVYTDGVFYEYDEEINSSRLYTLPVIELTRGDSFTPYRNQNEDSLIGYTWLPCGEPVSLIPQKSTIDSDGTTDDDGIVLGDAGTSNDEDNIVFDGSLVFYEGDVNLYYKYGDTYYSRYDCLKTYPFTTEDVNQVVEIGSFMLESYVNMDGRYDRNRGLLSNLNISPRNFNLFNPVYNQSDNFFSYKIMPADYYKQNTYPNQITWTKTKQSGADVDLWTNITMASTLDMDGDKGEITSIQKLNDLLLCFQDRGISQILYNENVQITTTQGVPVEIANSGKVQGKRYLSNSIGCSNKWSIKQSPNGIYFIDSINKNIHLFNGQFENISSQGGFNSWIKEHIPESGSIWNPTDYAAFTTQYDTSNQEVLFINKDVALAWSEKFNTFTSFYNYGGGLFLCDFEDERIWFRGIGLGGHSHAYLHQRGPYCMFFEDYAPYSITVIANPEPQEDKIFTNLEFRANIDMANPGDTALTPFDSLEVWNEYQHGIALIDYRSGHDKMVHHSVTSDQASLNRKLRIWRCDIPRDNYPADFNEEAKKGIYRISAKPTDRIRNMWAYVKLVKNSPTRLEAMHRTEIHDLALTYFS